TAPNLKYGISDELDVEAELTPLVLVRMHDSKTGITQTIAGNGDLFLRTKWAIIGNSGSAFALALDPYLKIPIARSGIGNGAVEAGLVVPVSLALSDNWSLGTTPEIDVFKNNVGEGRHANFIDVVGISRNIAGGMAFGGEIWEDTNFEPLRTTQAWSLD